MCIFVIFRRKTQLEFCRDADRRLTDQRERFMQRNSTAAANAMDTIEAQLSPALAFPYIRTGCTQFLTDLPHMSRGDLVQAIYDQREDELLATKYAGGLHLGLGGKGRQRTF